ncbi:hypothetical protein PE066_00645 [Ramlibacter tataouinensis]|uniref:O-antigen ligase family protein n=1 Tax=Ramlibacter tataouinensis TaxID=94132 RepID=UPI0022F3F3EE|nr:O-antigen ligase family protein [Ramlibacter tataouinensis]WBY02081.1 hypothetical protein PE066_00645 [Ramlibacter tataouinensis]
MKIRSILLFLTFIYFLFSGVTWVAGEAGAGAGGRITVADIVGLLLIGLLFADRSLARESTLRMPIQYLAFLPLLLCFLVGVVFSRFPSRGALELVVHAFGFLVSLALFNLYCRVEAERATRLLLQMVLYSGGILAGVGLVDFLIWPTLIENPTFGLIGTFRNTGQAGSFFGVYLAILIPGFLSKLLRANKRNLAILFIIVLALVFTLKRAALIGIALGVFLLTISMAASTSKRDKKYGVTTLLAIAGLLLVGYPAFLWGMDNVSGMAWRFSSKFNSDAIDDFSEGFMAENIHATFLALRENAFLGVGLGGVQGYITEKYEIHSTYLAMFANGGVLGFLLYVIFMLLLVAPWLRVRTRNAFGLYLRYSLPLFLGLLVSWAYTYHLRKREFWIIFFVLVLMHFYAKKAGEEKNEAGVL